MRKEKGGVFIEFVIALPVFILILGGVLEFSDYYIKTAEINDSLRVAGRFANYYSHSTMRPQDVSYLTEEEEEYYAERREQLIPVVKSFLIETLGENAQISESLPLDDQLTVAYPTIEVEQCLCAYSHPATPEGNCQFSYTYDSRFGACVASVHSCKCNGPWSFARISVGNTTQENQEYLKLEYRAHLNEGNYLSNILTSILPSNNLTVRIQG